MDTLTFVTTTEDTDPLTGWGQNVETKRRSASLNQHELAARAATSQQTISRVELGQQRPSDRLRVRIAKALGVKVTDLFGYDDEED